jgi:hypothetical protein
LASGAFAASAVRGENIRAAAAATPLLMRVIVVVIFIVFIV